MSISNNFPNLLSITKEKIKLSKLRCVVNFNYHKGGGVLIKKLLPVHKTPVYKYLNGDRDVYKNYHHYNYYGVTNEKRINNVVNSVKENGYPYKEQYVILSNGQNIVRDGQHRVAALFSLYGGEFEIEVLRFKFKGRSHFVRVFPQNLVRILKWILRNVYFIAKK